MKTSPGGLTDRLVSQSAKSLLAGARGEAGNDGYVSFELDPLLEDAERELAAVGTHARYIELGKKWAAGHRNRMIKVPETPGGLEHLKNWPRRHHVERHADLFAFVNILQRAKPFGAAPRSGVRWTLSSRSTAFLCRRVDVYTEKHVPQLSQAAARRGRHRQCQAHLEAEPGFLGREETAPAAGDHLCQHRHQETGRSPGNMSKHLPAPTSKPIRRRPTMR